MTEKLYLCSKCQNSFPLNHFNEYGKRCRTCRAAATKKWREANPEKARESNRKASARYRKTHPEKVRIAMVKWRKQNPEAWLKVRREQEAARKKG